MQGNLPIPSEVYIMSLAPLDIYGHVEQQQQQQQLYIYRQKKNAIEERNVRLTLRIQALVGVLIWFQCIQ